MITVFLFLVIKNAKILFRMSRIGYPIMALISKVLISDTLQNLLIKIQVSLLTVIKNAKKLLNMSKVGYLIMVFLLLATKDAKMLLIMLRIGYLTMVLTSQVTEYNNFYIIHDYYLPYRIINKFYNFTILQFYNFLFFLYF